MTVQAFTLIKRSHSRTGRLGLKPMRALCLPTHRLLTSSHLLEGDWMRGGIYNPQSPGLGLTHLEPKVMLCWAHLKTADKRHHKMSRKAQCHNNRYLGHKRSLHKHSSGSPVSLSHRVLEVLSSEASHYLRHNAIWLKRENLFLSCY